MSNTDLVQRYTRVRTLANTIEIQVAMVEWISSHESELIWHTVEQLHCDTTDESLAAKQQALLDDLCYFKMCNECNERFPVGRMHNNKICQGCAEQKHSVVY